MLLPGSTEIRSQLERWFAHAISAVDPRVATRRALDTGQPPTVAPGIIAIGKAAEGMAAAAVEWLAHHQLEPAGGIIIADQFVGAIHPSLLAICGDHPVPGDRSLAAADALRQCIDALPVEVPVHVFLSGGASSLAAAPLDGITQDDLHDAFRVFHQLGLDIVTMNALRGQLTRWSNGRLAQALGERTVQAWVISDVIGNPLSAIGSGPMLSATVPLESLAAVLSHPDVASSLAPAVQRALARRAVDVVRDIPHHIVADGPMAAHAVAAAAHRDSISCTVHREPIVGDATAAGRSLARWLLAEIRKRRLPDRSSGILVEPVSRCGVAHVWHSETTVSLPPDSGTGGRAQQMALAVVEAIGTLGWPEAATVMVAATDGRDGPTDAAGAVVNADTLGQLRRHDVDIADALTRCDAYPALDRVGALLRTGRTGTNVADLVVVWMWNWY